MREGGSIEAPPGALCQSCVFNAEKIPEGRSPLVFLLPSLNKHRNFSEVQVLQPPVVLSPVVVQFHRFRLSTLLFTSSAASSATTTAWHVDQMVTFPPNPL